MRRSLAAVLFFFKQKTAYEMVMSDWSSDVCSSDLAGFSSRGPAKFTYAIKPDICAPGVNVYSSVFSFGPGGFNDIQYDFALFQGTSMSSPHTAGSAALLLAAHPDWSPADVRSALVNAAA